WLFGCVLRWCVCFSALFHADFTTERAEVNHGRSAEGDAGHRTGVQGETGVGLLLKGKIVLHGAVHGARGNVHRSVRRQGDVDVAAVVDQLIFTAAAGVAVVTDISLGAADRDLGPGNVG